MDKEQPPMMTRMNALSTEIADDYPIPMLML